MDAKQRFLRRLWLIEHLDYLLSEAEYYRTYRNELQLPRFCLSDNLETTGQLKITECYVASER